MKYLNIWPSFPTKPETKCESYTTNPLKVSSMIIMLISVTIFLGILFVMRLVFFQQFFEVPFAFFIYVSKISLGTASVILLGIISTVYSRIPKVLHLENSSVIPFKSYSNKCFPIVFCKSFLNTLRCSFQNFSGNFFPQFLEDSSNNLFENSWLFFRSFLESLYWNLLIPNRNMKWSYKLIASKSLPNELQEC